MYCIGLTGGIACGKSTIAQICEEMGAKIISADKIAKDITNFDKNIIDKISAEFGTGILDIHGKILRPKLRDLIFTNPKAKTWLENLLHPLIRNEIERQVKTCNSKLCVAEIPLLKSREDYPYLNHVIYVKSDKKTQIKRLMQRDNCSQEQALQILTAQPSHADYQAIADTIIENTNDINYLRTTIESLINTKITIA